MITAASRHLPPPRLNALRAEQPIKLAAVPAIVIIALWALSPSHIGAISVACASISILLPWASYRLWLDGDQQRFPLFSMVSMMYAIVYVLPLFLGEHLGRTSFGPRRLSPDAIDNTMLLAVIGVLALGAGMAVNLPDGFARNWRPEFSDKRSAWSYVRLVFAATALLTNLYSVGELGQGGRQIMVDLEGVVVLAAFLALFRRVLRGESERIDRVLLVGYVVLRVAKGFASGWLGAALWFVLVIGVCYFDVRRRLPKFAIAFLIVLVLFLQPGKDEFRARYWHGIGNAVGSTSERTTFWIGASFRAWSDAIEYPEKRGALLGQTVTRLSLFEPTAMVMQMTPSQVPYQNGRLYKYLAITWIPRAIWPDKPSFNEANQFYQVAYGITDRRDLNKVSMSVGTLAESYINFGWFGPIGVMLLVGLLLNFIRRYFLDADRGEFLRCVGLSLLPTLLTVESQLAQYLSGIVQAAALTFLVFFPVLSFPRHTSQSRPGGTA